MTTLIIIMKQNYYFCLFVSVICIMMFFSFYCVSNYFFFRHLFIKLCISLWVIIMKKYICWRINNYHEKCQLNKIPKFETSDRYMQINFCLEFYYKFMTKYKMHRKVNEVCMFVRLSKTRRFIRFTAELIKL